MFIVIQSVNGIVKAMKKDDQIWSAIGKAIDMYQSSERNRWGLVDSKETIEIFRMIDDDTSEFVMGEEEIYRMVQESKTA